MGDMGAEVAISQGKQDIPPAPVNGTPGVDFLTKKPNQTHNPGLGLKIAGVVAGLATLFGADKAANTQVADAAMNGIGEAKTALKNAVVGEADPIIILRDQALYDLAVHPVQLPGHPREDAKFYKTPDTKEENLIPEADFAKYGIKRDSQGNVVLGRGYFVKGAPYPGGTAVDVRNGTDETRYGNWVQAQFPGGEEKVYVQDQFVRKGNPAPNVAQPQQ